MIKGLKIVFFSLLFIGLTACSAASQSGEHVTVGTGADVAATAS